MDKDRIIIDFNPKTGMWYVISSTRSYCTGFVKDAKDEIDRKMRKMSGGFYHKSRNIFKKNKVRS